MSKDNNQSKESPLDLYFERVIDVPRELVWKAWTQPEHLMPWFCPAPWSVNHCEIDLVPGGKFLTVMVSPEGQEFPNAGCYLEIIENEKLVWTDALTPGFRPAAEPFFTGCLTLEDCAGGTKYCARAMHANEETCKKHEEMGFYDGWNAALDQLIVYCKKMKN